MAAEAKFLAAILEPLGTFKQVQEQALAIVGAEQSEAKQAELHALEKRGERLFMQVSQSCVAFVNSHPGTTFADVDRLMRSNALPLYLVAVPASELYSRTYFPVGENRNEETKNAAIIRSSTAHCERRGETNMPFFVHFILTVFPKEYLSLLYRYTPVVHRQLFASPRATLASLYTRNLINLALAGSPVLRPA